MKKSNFVVYTLVGIVSAFLLWLWYYLGLNHIDQPLDLIISIVWWAVIIAAIIIIVRTEKRRKELLRTVYVSKDGSVYNAEAGLSVVQPHQNMIGAVQAIIKNLNYGFKRSEQPSKELFLPQFVIRTTKLGENVWQGKVMDVATKETKEFDNQEELEALIAVQA